MKAEEKSLQRDGAQINGEQNEPEGSDGVDTAVRNEDNSQTLVEENSANGLDNPDVSGGQDGRNIRGIGSTDMDGKNGVLRLGDQDNSTMEVTAKGEESAVASESKTNTSTASVTTAGPDDYASDSEVGIPSAQQKAKEQAGDDVEVETTKEGEAAANTDEEDEDIAQTGTSIDHQPTY